MGDSTRDAKENEIEAEQDGNIADEVQNVSAFRRILPQVLGAFASDIIVLNVGEFFGFLAILIPSLTGLNQELDPGETIRITAEQASWLPTLIHVVHPIGCLFGGVIADEIGRRKTIITVSILLATGWIILGFNQSLTILYVVFTLFGILFGLNEPAFCSYVIEICEVSARGTLMSIGAVFIILGVFIAMTLGAVFAWRQVSFICALFAIGCAIAMFFIPESPYWLLSKERFKETQKSLQWLRGWVSPQTVHKEFIELQNYSNTSNACDSCEKESIKCYHSKPTFFDKISELKKRKYVRPFVLIFGLQFLANFSGNNVWEPYIVQVLEALGSPIKSSNASVLVSWVGVLGCIFFLLAVKKLGKRTIFLASSMVLAFCCVGLSIYGYVFFPSGWISFKMDSNEPSIDPALIRNWVGNYSYLAFILVLAMRFSAKAGIDLMFYFYMGEVFQFKLRSILCGISVSIKFIFAAIASKTYYNIELWFSLPGACLFYGIISLIGFIVMYFIMPETEQRSLEDIERHYSDNTKGLTDIHIRKQSEYVENK